MPIGNAHALHGVPPPAPEITEVHAQPSQPSPSPASQTKEDALKHAESKINEDKLQVQILPFLCYVLMQNHDEAMIAQW